MISASKLWMFLELQQRSGLDFCIHDCIVSSYWFGRLLKLWHMHQRRRVGHVNRTRRRQKPCAFQCDCALRRLRPEEIRNYVKYSTFDIIFWKNKNSLDFRIPEGEKAWRSSSFVDKPYCSSSPGIGPQVQQDPRKALV
jgi:hypothetical protein